LPAVLHHDGLGRVPEVGTNQKMPTLTMEWVGPGGMRMPYIYVYHIWFQTYVEILDICDPQSRVVLAPSILIRVGLS
jgi:hypothetical protein